MGTEGRAFVLCWIGKIKGFWYDDVARRRNFGLLELQGVLE